MGRTANGVSCTNRLCETVSSEAVLGVNGDSCFGSAMVFQRISIWAGVARSYRRGALPAGIKRLLRALRTMAPCRFPQCPF